MSESQNLRNSESQNLVVLYMWRLAGRKSRVGTLITDNCVSWGIVAIFIGSFFSDLNGVKRRGTERPDVEAPKKCPCPAACASIWRLLRLFGDDTYAVVARPKWA